jgi:hypothetical protein
VEATPRPEITVAHIQDLIDTNKALRESVVSIAALLKEQAKNVDYPKRKYTQESMKGIDEMFRSRASSRAAYSPKTSKKEINMDMITRERHYRENWSEVELMSLEDIDEERMERRKLYESMCWT